MAGYEWLASYWWVAVAGYGVAFAGIAFITCVGTIRDAKRNGGTSFDGTDAGGTGTGTDTGTVSRTDDDGDDQSRANLSRAVERDVGFGSVQRPRYRHRLGRDGAVRSPVRPDSAPVA